MRRPAQEGQIPRVFHEGDRGLVAAAGALPAGEATGQDPAIQVGRKGVPDVLRLGRLGGLARYKYLGRPRPSAERASAWAKKVFTCSRTSRWRTDSSGSRRRYAALTAPTRHDTQVPCRAVSARESREAALPRYVS